jgi:nucleotide-binding universal stress UspA family protein
MQNITRILCPVDFSDPSGHALTQAGIIARWFDARVTVLHVYGLASVAYTVVPMVADYTESSPDRTEREGLLDATTAFVASTVAEGAKVDVVVEAGPTVPVILSTATAIHADLIVLGTHGFSGFEHLLLGSVTEKVLRKASCPVLTVPPRAVASAPLPFKRIVCAVDFSDSSLAALQAALRFAQEADAHLTLLHVLEWPAEEPLAPAADLPASGPIFDVEQYRRFLEVEARQRLRTLVPQGADLWCAPVIRVVHGKPHVGILEVAASDAADLIVLGVRGRSAVERMLFGSTANQVVRRATCPVLTVGR